MNTDIAEQVEETEVEVVDVESTEIEDVESTEIEDPIARAAWQISYDRAVALVKELNIKHSQLYTDSSLFTKEEEEESGFLG